MQVTPQEWLKLEQGARPRLFAFAKKLSGDDNLAHDLVQETLIQAYRKITSFNPSRGRFDKWAAGILINKWRDYNRPKQRGEIPMTVAFPVEQFEVVDPEQMALSNLDPEQRLFRTISNLSFKEMVAGLEPLERKAAVLLSQGKGIVDVARTLDLDLLTTQRIKAAIAKNILEAAMEYHKLD